MNLSTCRAIFTRLALGLAITGPVVDSARADPVADFYKGKMLENA